MILPSWHLANMCLDNSYPREINRTCVCQQYRIKWLQQIYLFRFGLRSYFVKKKKQQKNKQTTDSTNMITLKMILSKWWTFKSTFIHFRLVGFFFQYSDTLLEFQWKQTVHQYFANVRLIPRYWQWQTLAQFKIKDKFIINILN